MKQQTNIRLFVATVTISLSLLGACQTTARQSNQRVAPGLEAATNSPSSAKPVSSPTSGGVAAGSSTPSSFGPLHVNGSQLTNAQGEAVQLRGISSHGLQWYGAFMNASSMQWLRDNWNVSVTSKT